MLYRPIHKIPRELLDTLFNFCINSIFVYLHVKLFGWLNRKRLSLPELFFALLWDCNLEMSRNVCVQVSGKCDVSFLASAFEKQNKIDLSNC